MFQKKDIIYSETIGVCVVEDIVRLADNKKDAYDYYLLRSVYDKAKKAYIPVENHQVKLRVLIDREEAMRIKESDGFNMQTDAVKGEVEYVLK